MLTNAVAPDKLGGLERYVRELAEALVRQGVDVTVVAKATGGLRAGREHVDGLTVIRYAVPSKRNPLFAIQYPLAVALAVRSAVGPRSAGAILHGHFPVPMLPVLRRPFVYTMHAPVYQELLGEHQQSYLLPGAVGRVAVRVLRRLEATIVRRSSTLVTLSRFVRDEAFSIAGGAVEHRLIPGGLDTDHFSPGPAPAPLGAPVLFCARRLVERTGVEVLIAAMTDVVAALPDTHLYIAGSGPRRAAIEASIAERGLQGSVTLLGRISEADLLHRYRSADICVTPTLYLEGFGLSTAEALACGSAIVVSPAGANPELATGLPGVPVASAVSSEALSEAIVQTWRAVEQGGDLQQTFRARVHPTMSWDSVARAHVELYESVQVAVGAA